MLCSAKGTRGRDMSDHITVSSTEHRGELAVAAGQVQLYRVFDIAGAVDLAAAELALRTLHTPGGGVARLRLQRQRDGVVFTDPPVSASLAERSLRIDGRDWPVRVVAKVYDFGAMTVIWTLVIPPGMTLDQLAELSVELEVPQMRADLERWMTEDAELAAEAIRPALERPKLRENSETLTLYAIRSFVGDGPLSANELRGHQLLPSLLLGEREEFSNQLRDELLRSSYSYSRHDLVVIGYDQALVYDPQGTEDVATLLEFALAQVLELGFYDRQLDERITSMHAELLRRRPKRESSYDDLRRDLLTQHLDFSEVIEKIGAAVKVTEDLYYAAIYRGAMRVFRAEELANATQHKLEIMYRTYTMLSDEADTHTSRRLEWIVIVLILIEVVFGIIGFVERWIK
jgi:hypothetical protein